MSGYLNMNEWEKHWKPSREWVEAQRKRIEIEVDDMWMAEYLMMMQTGDTEILHGKPYRVRGVSCRPEKDTCTITLEEKEVKHADS